MALSEIFIRYAVALCIGIVVGLQREFSFGGEGKAHHSAGMRTFALFSMLGAIGAHLSSLMNSAVPFACVALISGAFLTVSYFLDARSGDTGITTRVSASVVMFTGAITFAGSNVHDALSVAVAITVVTVALLEYKEQMHNFAVKISNDDIIAAIKFAAITAIVLPLLPDHVYGPGNFALFNPFKIWLFVVFISAISFFGYILIKVFGTGKGIGLTGFLGGLISSTAVTFSFTERSRELPELSRKFAFAIIEAWVVMYFRVAIVVAVLFLPLAKIVWIPLLVAALAGIAFCIFMMQTDKGNRENHVAFVNPFRLGPAIKFGALFMAILVISKAAYVYLGNTGVYVSGFVGGLADVDAIALSMAKLADGSIDKVLAVRAIIIATIANNAFKGSVAAFRGSRELRKAILPGVIFILAVGIASLFFVK